MRKIKNLELRMENYCRGGVSPPVIKEKANPNKWVRLFWRADNIRPYINS